MRTTGEGRLSGGEINKQIFSVFDNNETGI